MAKIQSKQIQDYTLTQSKLNLTTPNTGSTSNTPATVEYVNTYNKGIYYSYNNLNMSASTTTTDGNLACSNVIVDIPYSSVLVNVNGLIVNVGSGSTASCYFSGDNGVTKRNIGYEQQGDKLYWVGSVAGYELSTIDIIDFVYLVKET